MAKIIIVESPTKAKEISHMPVAKGYTVKATLGHISDLPQKEMGIVIVDDKDPKKRSIKFDMPVTPERKALVSELKKLCKGNDVLIASDPDREGEAIAWHVENEIGKVAKSVSRIEFHSITETDVKKGLSNPRDVNENLVEAAIARRLLDRVIGYGLSSKAANSLGLPFGRISVGRVQLATVKLVYDREMEIRNHVPEPRWKVILKDVFGTEFASKVFENEPDAKNLLSDVAKNGASVATSEVKKTPERTPQPLTASLLQQMANKKFKWDSDKTMRVAQGLFEKGVISYHRTDSVRVSDETKALVNAYLKETAGDIYVPKTAVIHKNKNKTQDAHECIHPTVMTPAPSAALNADDSTLYKLIHDVFVASQSIPAIWDVTTVKSGTPSNGDSLTAKGKVLVFDGWRKFAGHFFSGDKKETVLSHTYKASEKLNGTPEIDKTMTKPPARYTEATLINEMEKQGIGRPSTYANTMGVIKRRAYIKTLDKAGVFAITPVAEKLIEWGKQVCPEFVDTEYTAKMEESLDAVELGTGSWEDVVFDADRGVKKAVVESGKTGERFKVSPEDAGPVAPRQPYTQGKTGTYKGKSKGYPSKSGYPQTRSGSSRTSSSQQYERGR